MRPIDADDLPISSIDATDVGYYVSKYGQGIPAVYWEDIKDAPTIEPERKKGKWILHYDEFMLSDGTSISGVECSKCGWTRYDKIHRLIACPYNFCPNCGAYMKEEQNENI